MSSYCIDHDAISDDNSDDEMVSAGLLKSRYYRAVMQKVFQVCWNYQKVMQSSFDVILADVVKPSDAADSEERMLENVAALDFLMGQMKDNIALIEVLQEIMDEFVAYSEKRLAEATADLESWRAQHRM
jgi:hypothetical protein